MYRTNTDINTILSQPPMKPFADDILHFLSRLSASIMKHPDSKKFPDLASFGFFIRKSNLRKLKELYIYNSKRNIGIGSAFHIAPSNVPLNFAYSLVAALLCGNPSIVRISSKFFEQTEILIKIINDELKKFNEAPFFTLIQYNHDEEINKKLSSCCSLRLIWGGDETIKFFKSLDVKSNVVDITFPDKYSLSLVDARHYNQSCNPSVIALKFYNDVYTFDQNACTAPRGIFWLGQESDVSLAQKTFWGCLTTQLKEKKYKTNTGIGIRHLNSASELAARNLIAKSNSISQKGINIFDIKAGDSNIFGSHSGEGLFYQKTIKNFDGLKNFISEKCQTLSVILNEKEELLNWVVNSRITGIDRICNMGSASDFSLHWDGKNLFNLMTKNIQI